MKRTFDRSFADFHDKAKLACFSIKNDKRPHEIAYAARDKYLFQCSVCHHEYKQAIYSVTGRHALCAFCANKKLCPRGSGCVVCYEKTFEHHHLEKVLCWSYTKNAFRPDEVYFASSKKIWFTCAKCYHDFQQTPRTITDKGTWCPFCLDANRKICPREAACTACYHKTFEYHSPEKALCWSNAKNRLKPDEVVFGSGSRFWFTCSECSHDFEQPLHQVSVKKTWCPFCANNRICADARNCSFCYNKTFEGKHPTKALCWSTETNSDRPDQVFASSSKKIWFTCDVCTHDFLVTLNSITTNGTWCAFCANKRICSVTSDCLYCFQKTFAGTCPEKALCWSYERNKQRPEQVIGGTPVQFWFICDVCNHDFKVGLANARSGDQWCSYCYGNSLCGKASCVTCTTKSIAGVIVDQMNYWDSCNTKTPFEVFRSSAVKYNFIGQPCGHKFKKSPDKITAYGLSCPTCRPNRCMTALRLKFDTCDGVKYELEQIIRCNSRTLKWDMVVNNMGNVFAVESDGGHHFSVKGIIKVSRGNTKDAMERFADQRTRDLLKEDHIRKTNGLLFRVSYRQLKVMGELVEDMIKQSNAGTKGVVYMDEEAYKDWGPIKF